MDDLKERLLRRAREMAGELEGLARALHDQPELSGEEVRSNQMLAARLRDAGFDVTTGQAGLPTAFVAARRAGAGPVVAFLAEYDALPGIGHGCGHNLIGTAALGAGLLLAGVLEELGGEVRVIGTPAEETLGGKVLLTEAGVFADVDAALMVHPGVEERVLVDSLACQSLEVTFLGRASHAVAHPEKGINALDPLLALFGARDALVRGSRPGLRIVGVITEGGMRPNIVPERAVGRFSLRAPRREILEPGCEAFRRMATALAEAHRCQLEIRATDRAYDEMLTNTVLAGLYRDNLARLGIPVNDAPRESMGSLDMGNVSKAVPSLHPFFAIAPPTVASHTREFAAATLSAQGRAGLLRSVQALALTGVDLLASPARVEAAAAEHRGAQGTASP